MENKTLYVRWISAITLLAVISCFVPVRCGSYCSYYWGSYYCFYYGNTQYYDSVKLIGKMVGGIIGGIAGFAILMCSVTIIIVKVCKKANHGRMVIQPAQPPVSYINTAQRLPAGPHDPNSTRLHSTPSIQVQPVIRGEEELHHVYQGQPTPVHQEQFSSQNLGDISSPSQGQMSSQNQGQPTLSSDGHISSQNQGQPTSTNHGQTTSPSQGDISSQNQGQPTLSK